MLAALTGWRGYLLASVVAALCAWYVQGLRYQQRIDRLHADAAQQLADATQLARAAEQARWAKREGVIQDAKRETEAALADADAARSASEQLRARVASLQRRARGSAAADGSQNQSGADTLDLLVGLLSGMDEAGRDVSRYADASRIAGMACERAYDSLR